jgi:acyl-CoA thioester hydrolase
MQNDNPIYPITLDIRIDWSELDLFGHVNNVSFFKYIQSSRVHYWECVDLVLLYKQQAIAPMLLSSQCRFLKPLFYPGQLKIRASITYIKNTSFGIKHQLLNDKAELVAEAEDVIVLIDGRTGEKTVVPDNIRAKIRALELS